MKKLTAFWYILKRSLLDPTYYHELAKVKFMFSYKYLWLLLTFLMLIRTVQFGVEYSVFRPKLPAMIQSVKKEIYAFYPQGLELRISNGKLYTNVEEPYVIDAPKSWGDFGQKHLIVIDTSATVEDYPSYNTFVLATRNAAVYPEQRNGRTSTQIYYFNQIKRSVYVDRDTYVRMLTQLEPYVKKIPFIVDVVVGVVLVLMPLFGGLFWASGILLGLVFKTAIVWLLAKVVRAQYGYRSLFKMGMHGSTWMIIVTLIMDITKQQIPFAANAIFFVWMGVVLWSLEQAAKRTETLTR